MNWLRKKNQSDENSYWQTIADALAALLLVILLIMMLLVLYIVRVQPNENLDMYEGNYYNGMTDPDPGAGDYGDHDFDSGEARYWHNGDEEEGEGEDRDDDGGGGGGGKPADFPEEGFSEGEGTDKAAVYVMVMDSETQRTIKEAGIRFELYTERDSLQLLNTYYPHKVEYRNFDTTADGVFYLPEKLALGNYYLHELTVPKGYDIAGNLTISVHENYDWPEPYVARVMLSPSKNIIRIQMTDGTTDANIPGGSYEVVASEDITTQDGTLRYAKGTIVTVIECNNDGYGESEELYLGKYQLREKQVPRFYAADLEPTEVTVEKKNGTLLPNEHTLLGQKTAVVVQLSDELYGNIPITNASFSFTQEGSSRPAATLRTDEFGQLHLTDLNKNTVYRLHQISSQAGYQIRSEDYSFVVDGNGMVEDQPMLTVELENRTLRAAISIRSTVLRGLASDYNVTLYDGNDQMVSTWDSTGMAHRVEGLTPGDYYICVNGQKQSQKHITVEDTKEIQSYSYSVWTTADIAAAAAIGLFAVGAAAGGAALLRRRKQRIETIQKEEDHE